MNSRYIRGKTRTVGNEGGSVDQRGDGGRLSSLFHIMPAPILGVVKLLTHFLNSCKIIALFPNKNSGKFH